MTKLMTTAERRGYRQICGDNGLMMVVACDQRGGMRKVLADTPEAQSAIDEAMLGVVKSGIVRHLANKASCVLLDAVCAVPGVVDDGTLSRDTGLLIGLDASGWDTDENGYQISKLVPGITARRVRELGGTGAKLMVYLRPDRPDANVINIGIIKDCIADFAAEDLLLVVEILTYQLDGESDEAYRAAFPSLIVGAWFQSSQAALSGDGGGLCRNLCALWGCALGRVVCRCRPRHFHRSGRNRDAKRGLRRHRRARPMERLHFVDPGGQRGQSGKDCQ